MNSLPPLTDLELFEKILYIVILPNEDGSGEWSPDYLGTGWAEYISMCPRNLYQLYPLNEKINAILHLHTRLSLEIVVLRTKDINNAIFKNFLSIRYPKDLVGVICIADPLAATNEKLQNLSENFKYTIFTSHNEKIIDQLNVKPKAVNQNEVAILLIDFLNSYGLNLTLNETEENLDYQKFSPLKPNAINYFQLKRYFKTNKLPENTIEYRDRCKFLVEYCKRIEEEKGNLNLMTDSFILAAPYASPFILKQRREALQKGIREKTLELDSKLIKAFLQVWSCEQDNNFNFRLAPSEFEYQALAVGEIHAHAKVLDSMTCLHSSFDLSPVMRLPRKGFSLNQKLSFFDPQNFNKVKKDSYNKVTELGNFLYASYPSTLMEYLFSKPRQICAISDLPIEWISQNSIPLSFISDVCRLPENPARTNMSQYAQNLNFSFVITPRLSTKIMVICGAHNDRNINSGFDYIKENIKNPDVNFVIGNSIEQITHEVNSFKPELLIFFTHGMANKENLQSELQIGNETLTNDLIVKHHISAPLVLLIACETAPLYGYHNPIAQAFFEAGATSVTGPVLPIDIDQGIQVCTKVINQLRLAVDNGIHKNWLAFLAHTNRSLIFDDYLISVAKENLPATINRELFHKIKLEWLTQIMTGDRKKAFETIKYAVSECFDNPAIVFNFLNSQKRLTETLFFTHWGRADLVAFDSWHKNTLKKREQDSSE